MSEYLSGLIYNTALRRSGDHSCGQEVVQKVLVLISRKAAMLAKHPELLAWVHEASRLETLKFLRGERRRRKREQQAMMPTEESMTRDLLLLADLDDSMKILRDSERELILMRFFEGETIPVIAARTGRSESAEKMRLKRALEKMAGWFGKKGVTLSAAGLTTVLSTEMGKAAPVGLGLGTQALTNTGVGSMKVALGCSLLLSAVLSVPLRKDWNDLQLLEERSAELSAVEGRSSNRTIRSPRSRRVTTESMLEQLTVDEIATRLLWNEYHQDPLEAAILKKQVERLDEEELKSALRLANAPPTEICRDATELLGAALADSIGYPDCLEFLVSTKSSVLGTRLLFERWCEESGLEGPGQWLQEMDRQPFFQNLMGRYDHQQMLWLSYLRLVAEVDFGNAVELVQSAKLRDHQLVNVIQALWHNSEGQSALLIEPLKNSRNKSLWAEVLLRSLADDEIESLSSFLVTNRIEGESASAVVRLAIDRVSRRPRFAGRLSWLRRNVPEDEWEDLFFLNHENPFYHDFRTKFISGVKDFEEALEELPDGPGADLLRAMKTRKLTENLTSQGEGSREEIIGHLLEIQSVSYRQAVIRQWVRGVNHLSPEELPDLVAKLERTGFKVEGGEE